MPVINGQFAYKALVEVMQNISLAAGLKFPPGEFTLVDVRLVNPPSNQWLVFVTAFQPTSADAL